MLLWQACQRKTEPAPDDGRAYFPLAIGKYIVYQYDSTIWNDLEHQEFHRSGELRYECVDTFLNNLGNTAYVFHVLHRADSSQPYQQHRVISASLNGNQLELQDQNLTYIRLVFPVQNSVRWDGNAKIAVASFPEYDNDKWQYVYSSQDQPFDAGIKQYPRTVTVDQIDDALNVPVDSTAYAYRNFSREVYGYGVGMVYSERIYWVFQPRVGGSGGSGYPKGYGLVMRAIASN